MPARAFLLGAISALFRCNFPGIRQFQLQIFSYKDAGRVGYNNGINEDRK
jgi:hypothetical protein